MNNANNSGSGHKNGRADGSGEGTLPPSRAPSPKLSMRDLRLHHLEYAANPDAKRLADFYAPQIIEMLRRGKYAAVVAESPSTDPRANGYMPPQDELTEEDMQALMELPL